MRFALRNKTKLINAFGEAYYNELIAYVAYRKAGYSRKFRQEHEEEILLHQAAKEAFNELNVKKPVSYTHLDP